VDINLSQIVISFMVLVFSLTVHESAHAWAADRLGDPTARALGRISLNPLVHADPIGTLLFPLVGLLTHAPIIGWAKPVPVATWRFSRPRRDYLLVAAAGPMSNLSLALVAAVALRLLPAAAPESAGVRLLEPVANIVYAMLVVNLLLAIFNMLPIPPLDGGTVLAGLLPERVAAGFDRLRPYGFVLLYVLMFSGGFSLVVGIPYRYMLSWLI
jgi:Zn-dependent protease